MRAFQLVCFFLVSVPFISLANPDNAKSGHKMPVYKGSAGFEKLKSLAGTWKGKVAMGKDKEKKEITIIYKVAGGGSTVIETSFPNTPQEMISVYHDQNKKLAMTHYCALHNQPKMKIKSMTKDTINFEFAGGSNLDAKKDAHMHALKLTFKGKDKIVQDWTMFKDGKKANASSFNLTRVSK